MTSTFLLSMEVLLVKIHVFHDTQKCGEKHFKSVTFESMKIGARSIKSDFFF